jgi:hypothetical protein
MEKAKSHSQIMLKSSCHTMIRKQNLCPYEKITFYYIEPLDYSDDEDYPE